MTSVLKEPVIAVAKNQVYKAALASKSDLRTEGATTAFAHFELKPPLVSLPSSSLPSLPPSLPYLPYGYFAFAKPSHYSPFVRRRRRCVHSKFLRHYLKKALLDTKLTCQ